jgi:hypothetical protein
VRPIDASLIASAGSLMKWKVSFAGCFVCVSAAAIVKAEVGAGSGVGKFFGKFPMGWMDGLIRRKNGEEIKKKTFEDIQVQEVQLLKGKRRLLGKFSKQFLLSLFVVVI